MTLIARVGVVAKARLQDATPHLVNVEKWLGERGIDVVFETATAALMPANSHRRVADREPLVAEVGRHGLVTDPAVHDAVLTRVTTEARAAGFARTAMTPSALPGATGNQEFFLHLRLLP